MKKYNLFYFSYKIKKKNENKEFHENAKNKNSNY